MQTSIFGRINQEAQTFMTNKGHRPTRLYLGCTEYASFRLLAQQYASGVTITLSGDIFYDDMQIFRVREEAHLFLA